MTIRVGYLQFCPKLGQIPENIEYIERALTNMQADLLVLPELATTGYALGDRQTARALAEPIPGPTTDRLQKLAGRVGGHIVVGLPEIHRGQVYNSAAVIGANGVELTYRKTHLFWNEKDLFTAGDTGFRVKDLGDFKLGVMICFDWAFPESAGTLARAGADIIAHPSNLVLPHAFRAMPIRSLENRIFTVTANRVGREPDQAGTLHFRGESLISAPDGSVLLQGPRDQDALELTEIDPLLSRDKYLTPQNHLFEDRRPEFYQ